MREVFNPGTGLPLPVEEQANPFGQIVNIVDIQGSFLTLLDRHGALARVNMKLIPSDELTLDCLRVLSRAMPPNLFSELHWRFLSKWSMQRRSDRPWQQLKCLQDSLSQVLGLRKEARHPHPANTHGRLGSSEAHLRHRDDIALRGFILPATVDRRNILSIIDNTPNPAHGPALYALHSFGEALRLQRDRIPSLQRFAAFICTFAVPLRPEWADYWKRIAPNAMKFWPDPTTYGTHTRPLGTTLYN